jgi:hypothetical protein
MTATPASWPGCQCRRDDPHFLFERNQNSMSVETRIMCDRCGDIVLEGRTVLRVETGPLSHQDATDLCQTCTDAWRTWMRQAEADEVLEMQPREVHS